MGMLPFRTQRLATSVVNRLLDLHDSIAPPQPTAGPQIPLPDPQQSAQLDAALTTPRPTVDADPQTAADIALGNLP